MPTATKNETKAGDQAGESSAASEPALSRQDEAKKIIRRNVYWTLGLGAIPIPLVDVAGVIVAQVKMVRELAAHYEVDFSESRAKAIVTTLITSIGGHTLSNAVIGSLVKLVPVIGYTFSLVSMPVIGGALTMTLGNIFMMHFESGGTLLDFDAEAMREHFRSQFDDNKIVVEEIKQERRKP